MSNNFYSAVEERRSYYSIGQEQVVTEERIEEVVNHAVKYTPSAFNSQGARVVLLFGEDHNRLWDITKSALKRVVPEEDFKSSADKINSFKAGYGTILFFIEDKVVESLQEDYPLYKDNFPLWAQQSNGMLQYVVWTSLEVEGLGASLQHYNELIGEEVKREWDLPESWQLTAQMPFGSKRAEPGEKEFQDLDDRMKVFK